MTRNEVQALLDLEGSGYILRVIPFLYRGKNKKVIEEYWHAFIGVNSPENEFIYLAIGTGYTNHKASADAFKELLRKV